MNLVFKTTDTKNSFNAYYGRYDYLHMPVTKLAEYIAVVTQETPDGLVSMLLDFTHHDYMHHAYNY